MHHHPAQTGFTLIELIAVIALLSVAAVSLGGLFSNAVSQLTLVEQINRSVQVAQGCAERILGVRQDRGYTLAVAEPCTAPAGYAITFTPTTLSPGVSGCPSNAPACTLRRVNVAQAGSSTTLASVVVLLVP